MVEIVSPNLCPTLPSWFYKGDRMKEDMSLVFNKKYGDLA